MIVAHLGAEGVGKPVPAVDRDGAERQVHDFLLSEVFACFGVKLVGHSLADARQCLGPGERGTLAVSKERRFAPGVERVQALLGFAARARVFAMHVEAVGAAVDLRGAHLDEFHERMLKAAVFDVLLQLAHGLEGACGSFHVIKSLFHNVSPLLNSLVRVRVSGVMCEHAEWATHDMHENMTQARVGLLYIGMSVRNSRAACRHAAMVPPRRPPDGGAAPTCRFWRRSEEHTSEL